MSENGQDESVEHVMVQIADRQLRQRLSKAIQSERAEAKRVKRGEWWSGFMCAAAFSPLWMWIFLV